MRRDARNGDRYPTCSAGGNRALIGEFTSTRDCSMLRVPGCHISKGEPVREDRRRVSPIDCAGRNAVALLGLIGPLFLRFVLVVFPRNFKPGLESLLLQKNLLNTFLCHRTGTATTSPPSRIFPKIFKTKKGPAPSFPIFDGRHALPCPSIPDTGADLNPPRPDPGPVRSRGYWRLDWTLTLTGASSSRIKTSDELSLAPNAMSSSCFMQTFVPNPRTH